MIAARGGPRALSARALRSLVAVALAALMVPVAASPAVANGVPTTYWVDAVNGVDDPLGGTEAAPFKTITYAVATATTLDTILIQPGTYDTTNGEVFPIMAQGECFSGVEGADVTIIHGDGASSNMLWQFLQAGDYIEGLTFENGRNDPGSGLRAICSNLTAAESPRIEDCVFSDNDSGSWGGAGLRVESVGPELAHPLIRGNRFIDNTTTGSGAGLYLYQYVSATVEDNVFIGNDASSGGGMNVVTNDAPLTCSNNYFDDNGAEYGGAVYTSLTGTEEQLYEGNAFYSNWAANQGGVFWMSSATVTMTGNDAGNNSSAHDGGFGYLWHTTVNAENNIIGGAHAVDAGNTWYMYEAALFENNDTVAGSFGSSTVVFLDTAYAEFRNCIYDNPDTESDFISAHLIDHCFVSDADVADPAKNNTLGDGNIIGGDAMMIGGDTHDPRLMTGSPCIDSAETSSAAAVDFYGDPRPIDGDGDGTAVPDMGACEHPALELGALSGEDRYETAAAIALENFDAAETAIVASGQNFPDALSAAGLAGALSAPLLLARTDSVPDVLATTLDTLGVTDIIIVGGEAAVTAAVADALADDGYTIERIAGEDRYETAAEVARRIALESGDGFSKSAFIARGDAFPDALSVSPLAYIDISPILLTRPGALPGFTADVITELDIEHAAVVGGTAAVSDDVKNAVDTLLVANGGAVSLRWFGDDRYATAVDVAENGVDAGIAAFTYVGVATGENYPDALAGGVGAGVQGGVVALTATNALSGATQAMLEDHAATILYLDVFGGPAAVADVVRTAIAEALGW